MGAVTHPGLRFHRTPEPHCYRDYERRERNINFLAIKQEDAFRMTEAQVGPVMKNTFTCTSFGFTRGVRSPGSFFSCSVERYQIEVRTDDSRVKVLTGSLVVVLFYQPVESRHRL